MFDPIYIVRYENTLAQVDLKAHIFKNKIKKAITIRYAILIQGP